MARSASDGGKWATGLRVVCGRSGLRLPTRMHAWLLGGELELATGHRRAGLTDIGQGLDDRSKFQPTFGGQELPTAASIHGQPAELGLRDPALGARVRQMRSQVQTMALSATGTGAVRRPLTLAAVQRRPAIDPARPSIVAYICGAGAQHASVITGRRASSRQLGSFEDIQSGIKRVSADFDLLAAPRVSEPVLRVARQSLRTGRDRTASDLLAPIRQLLEGGQLMLAGLGARTTVPGGLLRREVSTAIAVVSRIFGGALAPATCFGVGI